MRFQAAILLLLPAFVAPSPVAVRALDLTTRGDDGAGLTRHYLPREISEGQHLREKRAEESSKPSKLKGLFGLGKKGDKKNDDKKKDSQDKKKGESSKDSNKAPPIISHEPMDEVFMGRGLRQIDYALGNAQIRYAVIGGIAMMKLGSEGRDTADFDILVSGGDAKRAAQALATGGRGIGILPQSGKDQVWYTDGGKSRNIDVMEPGPIGGSDLNPTGADTVLVNGARILRPELLLNLKCFSWMNRDSSKADKKRLDAKDIRDLLKFLTKEKQPPARELLFNADQRFFTAWMQTHPDTKQAWQQLGFSA